jgi:predicted ATPase/DNA-binding winged helix-turn-helix (wHTH) protein
LDVEPSDHKHDPQSVTFGPFRLEMRNHRLFEDGHLVTIGSRAFEMLALLVERAGELVTKDELVSHVWPNTLVDESNLRTQMSSLRRTLRDGEDDRRFITTVPGRGYRFVALVQQPKPAPNAGNMVATGELPVRFAPLVGRECILEVLRSRLERNRLLTIVGHGGAGKTALALKLASQVSDQFNDGTFFVDMGLVRDASVADEAIAAALGWVGASKHLTCELTSRLDGKRILLVLDGCEHVVDSVAPLVELLLRKAPGLTILATSRERLRVEGEVVEHLRGLPAPKDCAALTAQQAAGYAAVELFVSRACAIDSTFALTDRNAPAVGEICARLDGLPLALEMAAGRIGQFGINGVAARLDKCLTLLVEGQRTASGRHRTLRATLDWSYKLLCPQEQTVLRRLGIFPGPFSLEAGSAVSADAEFAHATTNTIADLVSKSMVTCDLAEDTAEYRLLETTRAYALEKLVESGEHDAIAHRYVELVRVSDRPSDPDVTRSIHDIGTANTRS